MNDETATGTNQQFRYVGKPVQRGEAIDKVTGRWIFGTGPCRIPHIWIDNYSVYTNNPVGGSFRGFGVPQLTWAHESQMDMIAHRLGLEPVEIRMRNLFDLGDTGAHAVVAAVDRLKDLGNIGELTTLLAGCGEKVH